MKNYSIYMIALLCALACKQTQKKEMVESESNDMQDEWVSLFDGKTFNGWHVYNDGEVAYPWAIEDGVMAFKGRQVDTIENNLVTDKEYTNFKLSVDWKISEAGNSGIMWGVVEDKKYEHPYDTGPEIQVLDNEKHPDREFPSHRAGALYDLIVPPTNITKPVGEWNTCEIYINHKTNEGKAWLNGVLTAEFPLKGDAWDKMVSKSKFNGWEGYAKYETGRICLQDHVNQVWFKNIKIKELD